VWHPADGVITAGRERRRRTLRHTMDAPSTKTCAVCGRRIAWRKAWEREWDTVRFCSDGCRRHGSNQDGRRLETSIIELLDGGARSATIDPADAARAVGGSTWRPLVAPARDAARRLVASGDVVVTQGGRVVDPATATGPIRIRRSGRPR
jgi:hypothetical protein